MTNAKAKYQTGDYWLDLWNKNDIGWHRNEISQSLLRYIDRIQIRNSDQPPKAFVPLCGKTLDLKWLAEKGFEVVGVELSETACKEFFNEQNLPYATQHCHGVPVHKCTTLPIVIYQCDLYQFPDLLESKDVKFDFIWDRGSFVAVNIEDRIKYSSLMKDIYADKFYHLIEAYNYIQEQYDLFPKCLTMEDVQKLLGEDLNYELLDKVDITEQFSKKFNKNITYSFRAVYLVTRK